MIVKSIAQTRIQVPQNNNHQRFHQYNFVSMFTSITPMIKTTILNKNIYFSTTTVIYMLN